MGTREPIRYAYVTLLFFSDVNLFHVFHDMPAMDLFPHETFWILSVFIHFEKENLYCKGGMLITFQCFLLHARNFAKQFLWIISLG